MKRKPPATKKRLSNLNRLICNRCGYKFKLKDLIKQPYNIFYLCKGCNNKKQNKNNGNKI